MPARVLWIVTLIVAWLLWSVFVIQLVVPAVQRHVTMYAQLIAIFFILLPVLIFLAARLLLPKATGSK